MRAPAFMYAGIQVWVSIPAGVTVVSVRSTGPAPLHPPIEGVPIETIYIWENACSPINVNTNKNNSFFMVLFF